MPYVIGIILALGVGKYASALRLDRDRALYPAVAIINASYYVLFAVMGASGSTIVAESSIASAFLLAASLGFLRSPWLVCAALAGHGVLDAFHAHVVSNPGVPSWWPAFCGSFDAAIAGYFAWLLVRAQRPRSERAYAPGV